MKNFNHSRKLFIIIIISSSRILCSYYIIFRANERKKNFNPFSLLLAVFFMP